MVVVQYDSEDRPGEVAHGFRTLPIPDGDDFNLFQEQRCHLEVVRDPKEPLWLGFRAVAANNRFLQARRKGKDRLRFFNETFGTFEQFQCTHGEPKLAFKRTHVCLQNRRLPMFQLQVEVVRVGANVRSGPLSTYHGAAEDDGQGTVMRAMSSLLVKEWSLFVQREVAMRQQLMADIELLKVENRTFLEKTSVDIQDIRSYYLLEINNLVNEVRNRDATLAALHARVKELTGHIVDIGAESDRRKFLVMQMLEVKRQARGVAAAWSSWMTDHHRQVRVRTLLDMTAQRLARVRLEHTLAHWVAVHHRHVALAAHGRCAAQRLQRWRLARCFRAWAMQAYRSGASGRLLDRHVGVTTERLVTTAWHAWRQAVAASERATLLLARAAAFYRSCLATRAVIGWALAVAAVRRKRNVTLRAQRKWRTAVLGSAVVCWQNVSAVRRHNRWLVARVHRRRSARTLARAVAAWEEATVVAVHRRQTLMARCVALRARCVRRVTATAMTQWRTALPVARRTAHQAALFTDRTARRSSLAVLGAWVDAATDARRTRRLLATAAERCVPSLRPIPPARSFLQERVDRI